VKDLLYLRKPRLTWAAQAACRGLDVELFFSTSPMTTEAAKAVCRDCPVQAECLEEAMAIEDCRHGIFGGLTPDERDRLACSRPAA